jgi:rare lipoprotein A
MRHVAALFPREVRFPTWAAALGVAACWTATALFVAERIVSLTTHPAAPPAPAVLTAKTMQTPNRAAKAAREPVRIKAETPPRPQAPAAEGAATVPENAPANAGPGETGHASWYDLKSRTASGEPMDANALTAAHRTLPLGTRVEVANLDNGRAVVVRINDRGPFIEGRIIDVSKAAAKALGMIGAGVAQVSVSPVDESGSTESAASETRPPRR